MAARLLLFFAKCLENSEAATLRIIMKKVICLGVLLLCSAAFAETYCPCPGPCCPLKKTDSLVDMTSFLSPWTTTASSSDMMEKDLQEHRV